MRCKFEKDGWSCPLSAEEGEEYCYWHLPKDGKNPDEEKLKELKENKIKYAYLAYADLSGKNLRRAYLAGANLQRANLMGANLQGANLQEAILWEANLQEVNLSDANLQKVILLGSNLQEAYLWGAHLQGANISGANLQKIILFNANLKEADLQWTNLQGAVLSRANLQGANLSNSNLQDAELIWANLRQANLIYTRANSETILDGADLRFANIYLSYIDETKTLRNAKIGECDIHEILADFIGKRRYVFLDFSKIKEKEYEIASKLIKFVYIINYNNIDYNKKIVIFDKKEKKVIRLDFDNKGKLKEEHVEIPELNELIEERLDEFIFLKDKKEIKEFRAHLYDCAYEVYNSLYYFYIQNGRLDEALEMHYRRSEARRKGLKLKGILNWLRSLIYDFFLLRVLTGYGIKIWRPLLASLIVILGYAVLFWLTNGIVKIVNGKEVNPSPVDYIYYSIITFTTLGYANIQPNFSAGPIPQFLAASESYLGVLMIALLIFTITFRVSR